MKKYHRGMTVLLALFMGLALSLMVIGLFEIQDTELAQAAVVGPRVPYYSFLEIQDLDVSRWYVLVDLDDRANWPHAVTNTAVLKQINYTGVLSEADHWDLKFGVVITMGDDASLINWFHTSHRIRDTQFDTDLNLPEHGLNLMVNETDEDLWFVASKEYTTTVAITASTALTSPVMVAGVITTYAEVGDIILYVEEVEAAADPGIDLSVGVAYDTD